MADTNRQVKSGGLEPSPTTTLKIRTKGSSVNLKDIDPYLMGYFNTLPADILDEVFVTSGNDSDAHSKTSWHYHNKAVDLRYSHKLYDYMATDPNRIKYGVSLYNPNHGTAKHIHISRIGEEGVRSGAKEHTKDVFLNVYSPEAREYLYNPDNEKFKELKERAKSYGRQNYKGSTGVGSVAGSQGLLQSVVYNSLSDEGESPTYVNTDYLTPGIAPVEFSAAPYVAAVHEDSEEHTEYEEHEGGSGGDSGLIAQNQLLLSKLIDLEENKRKETEYNEKEAMNNKRKQVLAQKQQEYTFIKGLIESIPKMYTEEVRKSQPQVAYDPNMFRITNFQNNVQVNVG